MTLIYLNHAGTSWPKPDPVIQAMQQSMLVEADKWESRFAQSHNAICQFLGIEDPDQLLLTPGCTSAIATAIASIDLEPGSTILTSLWEHQAMLGPLMKATASGHPLQFIPKTESDLVDLIQLEELLNKNVVGLVALTAACNVTGRLLPIRQIVDLSRQHGAMVLVDAAQVIGWIDLDLSDLGADLVAFGTHKAMQTPWGIGGLFVSQAARMSCMSAHCELPTPRSESGASHELRSIRPGYCDVGSVDQCALAALGAAIDWHSQHSRHQVLRVARQQANRLSQLLATFETVSLFGGSNVDQTLPTVAFSAAGHSSVGVKQLLREHGVMSAAGHQCSPLSHQTLGTSEGGLVRLSVGVRQSDRQIDSAIERIERAITELS